MTKRTLLFASIALLLAGPLSQSLALTNIIFAQKRCLFAQLPKGSNQHLYLTTFANCPHGVMPKGIPLKVWERMEAGMPTIRVLCYANDCFLTGDIIRKYAEINGVLPPWDGQKR